MATDLSQADSDALRTCPMTPTRRGFFQTVSGGIYGAALAHLLSKDLFGTSGLLAGEPERRTFDLQPRPSHFEPRAATRGAWVAYGLGSENQSLPAYVVLDDPLGLPINGVENWQAGYLPGVYQGTRFRSTGSPVLNLKPETERPAEIVATERDLL